MHQQIVLVDDERDILNVLSEALRGEGYTPCAFSRAEQALHHLTTSSPALLITDLLMPGMSGQELILQTRAIHGDALPILIMSASVNYEAIASLPAQAFLSKPFDLDEFCTLVSRLATPFGASDHLRTRVPSYNLVRE